MARRKTKRPVKSNWPTYLSLQPESQLRLLHWLLSGLGFTLSPAEKAPGISGIEHEEIAIAINEERKHAVVMPLGLVTLDPLAGPVKESSPVSVIHREPLLAALDVQPRLRQEGYNADVLVFLNGKPFPEFNQLDKLAAEESFALNRLMLDITFEIRPHAVSANFDRLKSSVREFALGMGACWFSLDDLNLRDLNALLLPTTIHPNAAQAEIAKRLGIADYFAPPADLLLLGAIAHTEGNLAVSQATLPGELSAKLGHPVSGTRVLEDVDTNNPLEVALALKEMGAIRYRGSVSYTTSDGRQILHEYEKTPHESWVKRVSRIISLLSGAKGLFGG